MNEFALAQLTEHCQMVERGVKPASLLTIRNAEYQSAMYFIYNDFTLHAKGRQINELFSEIWIFKNYDLRFILELLPNNPRTPADHALIGYVLGYDTNSICSYIIENCDLDEPNVV